MGSTVFYDSANELATLTNTFTVAGVATDPTAVTLDVTTPTGTTTQYTYPTPATITKSATGVYTKDISCSEAGTWTYEWNGTSAASDTERGSWHVSGVDFGTLYCTPEALKSRTGISDSLDDREILAACEGVSRWIDDHYTTFARRTATMTFEPCGPYSLSIPDMVSVTTLKTDEDGDGVFETTWSASDYELQPVNAAVQIQPKPYTAIAAVGSKTFPQFARGGGTRRHRVQIVGVYGWPSIPAPVAQAAAILATDYLALGGMKFGVQGFDGYAVRARLSAPALSMLEAYGPGVLIA